MPPSIFALLPDDCIALIMHSYKIGLWHRMLQAELKYFFYMVDRSLAYTFDGTVSIMGRLNHCLMEHLGWYRDHCLSEDLCLSQPGLPWDDYRSLTLEHEFNELQTFYYQTNYYQTNFYQKRFVSRPLFS